MIYKCCEYLLEGLELRYNAIALCNRVGHIGGGDIVVDYYNDSNYKSFKFDIKKYIDKRKEVILRNQEDEVYPGCKECTLIHNRVIDQKVEPYISNIILHHWTKCNSHCIYCYTNKDKSYFNNMRNYKALPILKLLKKNNYLRLGGIVNYAGGEISCLDEFENISKFFDDLDYFQIYNSSGIVYEKTIEKHLKEKSGILIVSVDCGQRETHKLIKQSESYDKVWANLKKYSTACMYKPLLYAKYIILKGINDNIQEIISFFDKCKSSGITYTLFDIDLYYYTENRDKIPQYIIDLFRVAYNYSEKINVHMLLYLNATILFSQGKYADSFWNNKQYEGVHLFKIDKTKQICMISNNNIRIYPSIYSASIETKIEYQKIKKSCIAFKRGYKYIINNVSFAYALDIEKKLYN